MKKGPIRRQTKTFRSVYSWLHLLFLPKSTFSGRRISIENMVHFHNLYIDYFERIVLETNCQYEGI